MTTKEQVHKLVEQLSPVGLAAAREYLETLRLCEPSSSGSARVPSRIEDLVSSWIGADDAEEQEETGEYLTRVLDEDRLSDRKLFPAQLKGSTW